MKSSFERLMDDALRFTQGGDLQAATAAIQSALAGHPPAAEAAAEVIDVEARVVDAAAAPTSTDAASFVAGQHTACGLTRDYKLFIPPNAGGKPLPLVVMLHGCTQHPDDFAAGTRMNEAARAEGFFVLYPAQAQQANPQRCWNWFKPNHQQRGRGEPGLLASLTRAVMKAHSIDPARVYVAGLSAGGAMAAILGDTHPELFAAVGVHSGLPAGAAKDVNGAFTAMHNGAPAAVRTQGGLPTIVFHGDQDTTVHPVNGEQIITACRARAAGDAESARLRSPQGRESTRRVWRDSQGRVQAEHWLVHGAGHAWSGGSTNGSYTDVKGPDATREMLRFFLAHPKAN